MKIYYLININDFERCRLSNIMNFDEPKAITIRLLVYSDVMSNLSLKKSENPSEVLNIKLVLFFNKPLIRHQIAAISYSEMQNRTIYATICK